MCGIAGILDPGGVRADEVRAMTGRLTARGPDGGGVWTGEGIALGHRRLAVLDPTDRAAQPMARYEGALRIVFNGEIYNFHALRAELGQLGERFVTASDTEVLLAGYRHWGDALWSRLRGMFACALWDEAHRELVLARDPLGKKPLFWRRDRARLAFASTIGALRSAFASTPALSPDAINDFLANTVVSGEHTIFEGVRRVAPGHVVRVGRYGAIDERAYWRLSFDRKVAMDGEEAVRETARLLDQAVARRLVSDVPLGAFLSGGFDSGLVAASMARQSEGVRTFTVGTPGSEFDERALAASVARHLGTRHTALALAPTTAADLPRLLAEVGQPFGDSSLLPSYAVARAAREHVTVVLTGDGGDEGFFGYTAFQGIFAASLLRRALPFPRVLGGLSRAIDGSGKGTLRRRAGHVLRLAAGAQEDTLYNPMGFAIEERRALLRPELAARLELAAPERRLASLWRASDAADPVERFAAVWLDSTLIDTYLVKVDSATMATSLEARCPFLDVDLLEFLATVPRAVKFPRARRKHLLRPLVADRLPREILHQPKRGFSLPVHSWLRGALRPAFERFVLGGQGTISSLIDQSRARSLYERHLRGENHQSRLWSLLALGVWLAVDVDRTLAPDEPLGEWSAAA